MGKFSRARRHAFLVEHDRSIGLRRARRSIAMVIAVIFIPIVVIPSSPVAAANPATGFELDGNGFVDPATAPAAADWSCYFGSLKADGTAGADPNCAGAPTPLSSSGLLNDPFGVTTDDQFGQVKDSDQISGCANPNDCWEWKRGGANPDKNDLQHGGVMSFQNGTQTIAYFMADRYKVQGSAFLGFWFFRSPVTPNPIPAGSNTGTFSGTHTTHDYVNNKLGDILVLANFVPGNSGGGSSDVVTTAVFEWDITCTSKNVAGCADTNLRTVQPTAESSCLTSSGPVCAVFNQTDGVASPWPFTPADQNAPANKWQFTSFTEGGIDLTQVLGGDDCVTSFVVETRTSDSTDADLTDFIAGDINTCGKVTIVKDAQPNDAQDFAFTATESVNEPKVPASFSLDDDANATLSNTVVYDNIRPGNYTFTETGVTGWALSGITCTSSGTGTSTSTNVVTATASVTLGRGGDVTCTFTNAKRPTLKLVKSVVNNNGGISVANDWDLTATGTSSGFTELTPAAADATSRQVDAGVTYTLGETGPTGYSPSNFSCDGGISGTNTITLSAGQNVTCTITNDDTPPQLHLRKIVTNDDGGTATVADFTLTADGTKDNNDLSGTDPVDSGASLQADTWALSETTSTGYTGSDWVCVGGTQTGNSITVGIGGSATCTVTNDDIAPQLKLVKTVTNDSGGTALANDWDLTATGSDAGFTELTPGAATFRAVKAGVEYTLSEDGPSGYAPGSWSCTGGGSLNVDKVTVGVGESVTCTINNNDVAPQLKLVKTVTNDDGGSADANEWDLTATGTGGFTELTPAAGDATFRNVTAGVKYTLSESGPDGYTPGDWSCSAGTQDGDAITLAVGQSATCTIDNDDIAPGLKLVKTVTNNNGGSALANDWELTATGSGGFTESSPDATTAISRDVTAGVVYTLSEDGPSGYTPGSWSCTGGGTQVGNTIELAVNESVTCTINNDDIAPQLKLVKTVTNNNGGLKAPNDWDLTATGSGGFTELTPDATTATARAVTAGVSYTLSETTIAGYVGGDWTCTGDGEQVDDTITLGVGESATCTINNDDQTAHLRLVKVVINDNGGTAEAEDFTLSAAGPTPLSGAGGAESDVNAGTYNLSETGLTTYTAGTWSCVGGLQNGTNVALALGESATCTITNDDKAPKLHLRKVVVNDNGGTATAANFTLTADGTGTNDLSGSSPVDSGAGLDADTWALSESTSVTGYTARDWVCVGGSQSGTSITLGLGQEATCTITNDDIAPILHLRKVVVNDNGGTATAANFTLTANGTGTNDLSGTSPVDSGAGLKADTWALSETNVYGYTASAWSCAGGTQNGSNITVGIGGEATCTITNNDQPGKIVIIKNAKPAQGSFAFTTTGTGFSGFTLTGSTANGGNRTEVTLNAGSYSATESTQLGWILTGIGGSTDPNTPYNCTTTGSGGSTGTGDLNTRKVTITLKIGDAVTCVFENTGQGVTRTQGFWSTHPQLANIAWFGGTAFGHTFPGVAATAGIGDNLICGRPLDTLGKVTGSFWSDIAKKSTGSKRTALDQARMQLLQQLIAAELNASAFGSVPAGGVASFAAWETALCGTNQTAIKNAQQQAASFNSAGDSGQFTPGTSADSKYARSIANFVFWDVIKP